MNSEFTPRSWRTTKYDSQILSSLNNWIPKKKKKNSELLYVSHFAWLLLLTQLHRHSTARRARTHTNQRFVCLARNNNDAPFTLTIRKYLLFRVAGIFSFISEVMGLEFQNLFSSFDEFHLLEVEITINPWKNWSERVCNSHTAFIYVFVYQYVTIRKRCLCVVCLSEFI